MQKYFLILGLLFFVSCKKADESADGLDFYFETPQPINDSELSKIPNKFQGLYMNSDSTFLNIKENTITRENIYKFRFHKTEMDSLKQFFDFSNGKYISKLDHDVYDFKNIGDSIEMSNKQIDTIFIFSNSQKAKRINGQLVLNTKDSIFWKIRLVNLEKDILKIKYIYSNDDLKMLDSITTEKSRMIDSTSFIIRPTRKEFKDILNLKNIGESQQFKTISKSAIKNR